MSKILNTPTDIPSQCRKGHAIWSMDNSLLASKQAAINGEAKIVYDRSYTIGGKVHNVTLYDPTYSDLFKVADLLMQMSGDFHHVFVEDFIYNEEKDHWELITGS